MPDLCKLKAVRLYKHLTQVSLKLSLIYIRIYLKHHIYSYSYFSPKYFRGCDDNANRNKEWTILVIKLTREYFSPNITIYFDLIKKCDKKETYVFS